MFHYVLVQYLNELICLIFVFQEEYWKTRFFASSSDYLVSRGYEPDSDNKKKSQLQIQQALMRLFAVSCQRL